MFSYKKWSNFNNPDLGQVLEIHIFMKGGSIKNDTFIHLTILFPGSNRNGACLSWPQRLRIALESSQGMHSISYFYSACICFKKLEQERSGHV
jgi:hypothetical protein